MVQILTFTCAHWPLSGLLVLCPTPKTNIYTLNYNLVLFWLFVPFLVLDEVLVVSTMTPESVTWPPVSKKRHFHLRREDKAVRSWWVQQMISKVYFGDCAVSLRTIQARQYSLNHDNHKSHETPRPSPIESPKWMWAHLSLMLLA